MSAQVRREHKVYYDTLEWTQKGELDVTRWQDWFLNCLLRAIEGAQETLSVVLQKARFRERFAKEPLNERQIKVLSCGNALLNPGVPLCLLASVGSFVAQPCSSS